MHPERALHWLPAQILTVSEQYVQVFVLYLSCPKDKEISRRGTLSVRLRC